jgi:hypothetical protein
MAPNQSTPLAGPRRGFDKPGESADSEVSTICRCSTLPALPRITTLCLLLVACGESTTQKRGAPLDGPLEPDAAATADLGAGGAPTGGAPVPGGSETPDLGDGGSQVGDDAEVEADAGSPDDAGTVDARPDPDAAADAAPDPAPAHPVLTECMARNAGTLADEDGDHPDWIELHNPSLQPLSLAGYALADDRDDETPWRLPDLTLPPGGYVVVFASDKDRDDPERPLHTDFKLSGDGESVYLFDADGEVVDRLDDLPPQAQDLSWGRPMQAVDVELVAPDAEARFTEPTAMLGGGGWNLPDFDDGRWRAGRLALGYDRSEPPRSPGFLGHQVAGFSGVQGRAGWSYGYRDLTAAPEAPYDPADFQPFAADATNGFIWRDDRVAPDTWLTESGASANGVRRGPWHWAIRRWTSPGEGRVRLRGVVAHESPYGDGVVARIFREGQEVFALPLELGIERFEVVTEVENGTRLDFVLDPGALGDGYGDESHFAVDVELFDPANQSPGQLLVDSVNAWRPGVQGDYGLTFGTWDRGLDADGTYAPEDFRPFPRAGAPLGPTDWWDGTVYRQPDAALTPPWLGALSGAPGGTGRNGAALWVIRRFTSPVDGDLVVRWHFAKAAPDGTGTSAQVLHAGRPVDGATLDWSDLEGVERFVTIPGVRRGDPIDFAHLPGGDGLADDELGDAAYFDFTVWARALPEARIGAEVVPGNGRPGIGLFVRVPFEVPAPDVYDRVLMEVEADDGFVAFVNGVEVGRVNAPDAARWNARALVDEPPTGQVYRLAASAALLRAGTNVLALHALDFGEGDTRFYVAPRLIGRTLVLAEEAGVLGAPTPGADNVATDTRAPPTVQVRTPWPDLQPGAPVVLEAEVLSGGAEVSRVTAQVRWGFDAVSPLPMARDEDGLWRVEVPGDRMAPGELFRFVVEAEDTAGRTSRAPRFDDPRDADQFYGAVVEDPALDTPLPVLHWFVTAPQQADTLAGTRAAIFWQGELYDNVRFSIHGQSTQAFPKKSYNVDLNADHRMAVLPPEAEAARAKDFNLLSNWADKSKMRNTLAWETYRDAGADAHYAFPVHVRRNGEFFGVYDLVEDGDDRLLERNGRDPNGALYKMYDGMRSTFGGEKKTRTFESKADLQALLDGLALPADQRALYLYDHVDLAMMANFLAAMFITNGTDCCHKNYYAYRDTEGTGEWGYIIWDLDLTFGRNWDGVYVSDRIHVDTPLYVGTNNQLTQALVLLPEFNEMYLRRTRTLVDTLMQPPGTPERERHYEARIDELFALLSPDAQADFDRWPAWGVPQTLADARRILREDFLEPRRRWIYTSYAPEYDAPEPLLPRAQTPADEAGVVVERIAPEPDAPETAYVVLHNTGATAADLSGFVVRGAGIVHKLNIGTVLPADGRLYLAASARGFRARVESPRGGEGRFVQGDWTGTLEADAQPDALVISAPENRALGR